MKKIFLLATATAALMACSNNDEPVNNELIAARITANINGASDTRAAGTQWTANDEIGVTCSSEGASYANVKYTTTKGDGTFTTSSTPFYFPDVTTSKSFTAYYPYKETSEMTEGAISGSTAATNQTSENQPKIDYLWADTKTATGGNPNVNFSFAHKMSKLTLKFQQGGDVTLSNMQKYKLSSLVLEGTFNTTDGTAAAKEDGTAGDLEMEVSGVSPDSNNEFSLILYPQTISSGLTLSVDVNDNLSYKCKLKVNSSDLTELTAGNNYSFTITVSKAGLIITNSTISDWTAETGDAGTAYPG